MDRHNSRMDGSARQSLLMGVGLAAIVAAVLLINAMRGQVPECAPDQPPSPNGAPSPPDQVFCYQAAADGEEIQIEFVVDEGGYLYRKNFSFGSADPAVQLQPARFPAGQMHEDEFFGEQEIYRETFAITVPYTRTAAVDSFELEIGLQGCDEIIGLCYPPQDWVAEVALPDGPIAAVSAANATATSAAGAAGTANSAAAAASTTAPAPASGLRGSVFAGGASDDPIPVEQAFVGNARFDSANELTIAWQIEPGYYLYRDEFSFAVDGDIQFGTPNLPPGEAHTDQNFGNTEVYYDLVEITVPFARVHPDEMSVAITAGFQGCKDESICYPPAEQVFELALPASADFPTVAPARPVRVSEQDALADLISNGTLLAVFGTFFVAGLGLSLTPCVYPMIPILSSIISGQGDISRGRSFALSVSYVLGMAVTYSVAGAITAMAGSQVQAVFQQPWIIVTVAGLFLIMAMSMFGLFEIQVPSAIQSRLSAVADKQKSGSYYGTAVIGALSALIVTTCVAPPLIAGLISIGQSGEVARGSMALFVMAIGMGVPLLLIGASAGQLLPRVGPWMNAIKAGFGVVMIGMAIWMLDRILSGTITLYLWALLVFLTGVFLGAFDALPEDPKPARRLGKGIGVLACLYGAIMLIGATLGGDNPTRPIPAVGGLMGQAAPSAEREFMALASVNQLETLLLEARTAGQPVFVDFTADWCASCKEMEAYTFPDPAVIAALEPYMLLRADVTDHRNEDNKALLEYFEVYGPPALVFFDRAGEELYSYREFGFVEADEFAAHVTEVARM